MGRDNADVDVNMASGEISSNDRDMVGEGDAMGDADDNNGESGKDRDRENDEGDEDKEDANEPRKRGR